MLARKCEGLCWVHVRIPRMFGIFWEYFGMIEMITVALIMSGCFEKTPVPRGIHQSPVPSPVQLGFAFRTCKTHEKKHGASVSKVSKEPQVPENQKLLPSSELPSFASHSWWPTELDDAVHVWSNSHVELAEISSRTTTGPWSKVRVSTPFQSIYFSDEFYTYMSLNQVSLAKIAPSMIVFKSV